MKHNIYDIGTNTKLVWMYHHLFVTLTKWLSIMIITKQKITCINVELKVQRGQEHTDGKLKRH